MKKILFYDDVLVFGGHEIMALAGIRYIIEYSDLLLDFICHEENKRLRLALENLNKRGDRIKIHLIKPRMLDSLEIFFARNEIAETRRLMKGIDPDVAVVIQGRIEISYQGLVASKKAGYPTISYIPLAHRMPSCLAGRKIRRFRDMKDFIYVRLEDIADRYFYGLPDKFITISKDMKDKLISNGAGPKIDVVYNGTDLSGLKIFNKADSRERYGLNKENYLAALIGRIAFSQKGQDFLIDAVSEFRDSLEDIGFLIIGEGPDKQSLEKMIAARGLAGHVRIIPWQDDLSEIYSAVDMLVIPSRFEGMPLVMTEAMYYRLPVIASDVDGMAELLPREWLFKYGDREGLIRTLRKVRAGDNTTKLDENRRLVMDKFRLERFGADFMRAVTGN
ncbi:MAG: glycosyltransferase [Nitrospiraceae bacterium]|nr:glycosyltransferase [Nitrospiraceae bacterium]